MRSRLVRIYIALVVAVFAVILYRSSSDLDWRTILGHPGLLAAALGLQLANVAAQFVIWFGLTRTGGAGTDLRSGFRLYAGSSISRYLPAGKVLQFASFGLLTEDAQLRSRLILASLLMTAAGTLSGLLIVFVGLPWFSHEVSRAISWGAGLIVLTVALAVPLPRALQFAQRLLKRNWVGLEDSAILSRINLGWATAASLAFCWLAELLAGTCLLRMVNPDRDLAAAAQFSVAYALAYFGGMLATFVPGGIGVREGVLIALASGKLKTFEAVFVALGLRGTLTFAELVFFSPALWLGSRPGRQRAQA
jgi:hypothetical protein